MDGALRTARGVVVGLVIVLFAVTSHRLVGGTAHLATAEFVGASVLCVAGCVALSGREWTLGKLVLVLVAAQVAFHVVLSSGHGPMMSMQPAAGAMASDPLAEPRMALAHGAAALATGLLLRHGERCALAALGFVAHVLTGRIPPRVVAVPEPMNAVRRTRGPRSVLDGARRTGESGRAPPGVCLSSA